METIGPLLLMLIAGVLVMLLLIGLAIALGFVRATEVWVVPDVKQERLDQIRLKGRTTRRAMDAETQRYFEELYQVEVAAIEADYARAATQNSSKSPGHQTPRSTNEKGGK